MNERSLFLVCVLILACLLIRVLYPFYVSFYSQVNTDRRYSDEHVSSQAALNSDDKNVAVALDPSVIDINLLLNSYKKSHGGNITTVGKEICDRTFIVATYACPLQVGNRMHEFLNAFAAAVITDRTLLWQYCNRRYCRTSEDKCARTITRQPWIYSYKEVAGKLAHYGCPLTVNPEKSNKNKDEDSSSDKITYHFPRIL